MNHRFDSHHATGPLLTVRDRHFLTQRLRIPKPLFGPGIAAARATKHGLQRKEVQLNQK